MRTFTRILLVGLAGAALVLAGCGGNGEEQAATTEGAGYEDGVYFAQAEFSENSGWKDVVVFEVEDGEITMVEWNAAHEQNGPPKDTRSRQGDYGMVENSDATLHWYEQAEATEQWLIENQDIDQLELDDEGRPDAISQATIRVGGFKSLVQEALDTGPVGYGMWEDGTYFAEQEEFSDNGWKATVAITVIGGRIVAVEWDSFNEDEEFKSDLSREGEYGMVEQTDAIAPWHEQANAAEQWLIENQDPSELPLDDEGASDAISGASITVSEFKALAEQALEGHER
jgi:major membrane immunogen (membrane-anchored lipoprotein)